MNKLLKKTQKPFFRNIHLQAALLLLVYTFLSKTIFVRSITLDSVVLAFLIPYTYGVLAGLVFLFLFNHEDFFHFMKEVEKKEEKKEKTLLKKYLHYGKVISTLIIATLGGPVLSALTIRLILNKYKYRYVILALGNITSTLMAVALAKGFLHVFVY